MGRLCEDGERVKGCGIAVSQVGIFIDCLWLIYPGGGLPVTGSGSLDRRSVFILLCMDFLVLSAWKRI